MSAESAVILCPTCQAPHRLPERHERAPGRYCCARCETLLLDDGAGASRRCLALSLAALILYLPANAYPVLSMEKLGVYSENTIWQGVRALQAGGYWGVALLVFLASMVIPLLKLLVMMHLALLRRPVKRPLLRYRLLRFVRAIGPWSMLDVFLVAILVSLVKLGDLATIHPEPGLVAFAAVVVLTQLASASFSPTQLWRQEAGHE